MSLNKENIATGADDRADDAHHAGGKDKTSRKMRSKSLGGGILGSSKPSTSNRRKSVLVNRAALNDKDDEATRRREARRKSLANRRVSFAPEATLHTWDVIEYLRDAPAQGQPFPAAAEPTSNEAEDDELGSSPLKMTPDDDDDDLVGESGEGLLSFGDNGGSDESDGDVSMEMANDEITAAFRPWIQKGRPDSFTTPDRRGYNDSDGENSDGAEMSMDVTRALGRIIPPSRRQSAVSTMEGDMTMDITQAIGGILDMHHHSGSFDRTGRLDGEGTMEMSMDMTQAVGQILAAQSSAAAIPDDQAEMSMDLTRAVGGILSSMSQAAEDDASSPGGRRVSLKRRLSQLSAAYGMSNSVRSPDPETSNKRRLADGDGTMDLTVALGGIVSDATRLEKTDETDDEGEQMDETMPIGAILRRSSSYRPRKDAQTESDEDLSMELTGVLGQINQHPLSSFRTAESVETTEAEATASSTLDGSFRLDSPPSRPVLRPSMSPVDRTDSPRRSRISVVGARRQSVADPVRPESGEAVVAPVSTVEEPLSGPETTVETNPGVMVDSAVVSRPSPRPSRSSPMLAAKAASPIHVPAAVASPRPREPAAVPVGALITTIDRTDQADSRPSSEPVAPAEPVKESVRGAKGLFASLSSSFKLLSTPTQPSPLKPHKLRQAMSRRSPVREFSPQKRPGPVLSPLKSRGPAVFGSPGKNGSVQFVEPSPVDSSGSAFDSVVESYDGPRISLSDFLDLTNIRFLDLTTTKRRHTAAPSTLGRGVALLDEDADEAVQLQLRAKAAVSTVPMLSLFQHSCQEMRHYIAGGKDEVREIEAEAAENQPPLFTDYLAAPPSERAAIDIQLKNIKTNARLQSKAGWYSWRAQLLRDLMTGLEATSADLLADETALDEQEKIVAANFPAAQGLHRRLVIDRDRLRDKARHFPGADRPALREARDRLATTIETKRQKIARLASLKSQAESRRSEITTVKALKVDHETATKSALESLEQTDDWTVSQVIAAKTRADRITAETGWAVRSCRSTANSDVLLSLVYKSELELAFCPRSFQPGSQSGPNQHQIRIKYVGNDSPRPIVERTSIPPGCQFMLGLLQSHLDGLIQNTTTANSMLLFVAECWDVGCRLAESARLLRQSFITRESTSDDRFNLSINIIMPSLETKVVVSIDVNPVLSPPPPDDTRSAISVFASVSTTVCYGERYDDVKLSDFLSARMFSASVLDGNHLPEPPVMASAVTGLKLKLLSRGRQRQTPSGVSGTVHPTIQTPQSSTIRFSPTISGSTGSRQITSTVPNQSQTPSSNSKPSGPKTPNSTSKRTPKSTLNSQSSTSNHNLSQQPTPSRTLSIPTPRIETGTINNKLKNFIPSGSSITRTPPQTEGNGLSKPMNRRGRAGSSPSVRPSAIPVPVNSLQTSGPSPGARSRTQQSRGPTGVGVGAG